MAAPKPTNVSGMSPGPLQIDQHIRVAFPPFPGQEQLEEIKGTVTYCDSSGNIAMKTERGRMLVFTISNTRYITVL